VDLRNHLFAQIERLNDPSLDLDKELEKAKALASIGNVIVNSAKVELDYMRVSAAKKGSDKKVLTNG
jgi:CO dehydrogenase/acetyl-CoA synthase delta subunit